MCLGILAALCYQSTIFSYSSRLKHILTRHEQGAIHAADGYARASGKPGVVIATSGPGATNLVTGIATAQMDSVPLVCITGNVSAKFNRYRCLPRSEYYRDYHPDN